MSYIKNVEIKFISNLQTWNWVEADRLRAKKRKRLLLWIRRLTQVAPFLTSWSSLCCWIPKAISVNLPFPLSSWHRCAMKCEHGSNLSMPSDRIYQTHLNNLFISVPCLQMLKSRLSPYLKWRHRKLLWDLIQYSNSKNYFFPSLKFLWMFIVYNIILILSSIKFLFI